MGGLGRICGVLSPVVTPFDSELRPDRERFVRHCRWLIDQGVGLAVFGTNSEANSMSVAEKIALLDALIDAGLPPARMMPGTGCCAFTDSVELTRHALRRRCAGVLMLPPFYYKGVPDNGLFRSYAEIIERVGESDLRIYLYHIPPVSQVPISLALIERLLQAYPGTIAGIKDSSGDWSNTQAMLERFQPREFDVFAGSETFLLATLRGGGAGCITATGNVNPSGDRAPQSGSAVGDRSSAAGRAFAAPAERTRAGVGVGGLFDAGTLVAAAGIRRRASGFPKTGPWY